MHAVKGKAIDAGIRIDAHRRHAEANQRSEERLQRVVAHHAAETGNREHHQREVLCRTKRQRPVGEDWRKQNDADDGDG